ncbi:diacylglycerol kinase family lipid kinase [Sabulilitoribacter arenilitoris]|uniref:Diacylglycerol kinase family lipid kinase n=1 Tax=Wocania arenilitoris TaxID=2044858 RepID=A0AAE3EKW6_9FLAO|nr:diacylglycerol kinase family protein [Wocania arenilitoris]MCF7566756.1 diacylglycerol kinase family lipid kinase [Wocania arenilitoris]
MDTASKSWFVIINPTSGNGSGKKNWPKIKSLLEKHEFIFEHVLTTYSKHSIKLVHQAIKQNFKNIISVGGDGTLHNIVNGIMTQNNVPTSKINVGVIPIGTGNDWVKTHKIPKNIDSAIQLIKNKKIAHQDIGKIEFLNQTKTPVYFNNLAGIGFDGYVVSKVNKHKYIGALAYLYGTLISLFFFKNFESKVSSNSETISGKTLMVLVGVCKYSGGGMQLTDSPNPFDGYFDISIAKNLSKLDVIKNVSKLFNGKISNHKKIQTFKSKHIKVEINQDEFPFIQADGELIGTGNIKITLIPKAFSLYC